MDKIIAFCPNLHTLAFRMSAYNFFHIDEAAVHRYMNEGNSNLCRLLLGSYFWEVRANCLSSPRKGTDSPYAPSYMIRARGYRLPQETAKSST